MSSAQKAPRLTRCLSSTRVCNGKIYRSEVQAVSSRGNRSVPEERCEASRVEVQARSAAGRREERAQTAPVGVRFAAAREAEAAPHVRSAGAPVPQLLSEGRRAPR